MSDSYLSALLALGMGGALCPEPEQLVYQGIIGLAHVPTTDRTLDEWAPEVLALLRAVPLRHRKAVFRLLDGGKRAGPSYYGYTFPVNGQEVGWHWKLRRVRNDPQWGARLFQLLESDLVTQGGER